MIMHRLCCLLAVFTVFVVAQPADVSEGKKTSDSKTKSMASSSSTNHFAYEFLKIKASETANENIVFSSFSIARALYMVYAGSEGNTKSQIRSTLGWEKDEDLSIAMLNKNVKALQSQKTATIAEHVWVDDAVKILDSYSKIIGDDISPASFSKSSDEMRLMINKWIEEHTDKEIKDFFPDGSINDLTRLVLVNTILFKGLWKMPFNKEYTRPGIFNCENGHKANVQFMFKNEKFNMIEHSDFEMVEIPYQNDEYSFIATLPLETSSVGELVKKFESHKALQKVFDELRRGDKKYIPDIDLHIPKFKISEKINLKEMLPKMGIEDLFVQETADLSGITGDKSLYCSSAYHQATVEIDEEGTKASAATGFGISFMSLPPSIRLNRPFIFHIIHNKSNEILFTGIVKKFD